MRTLHIVLPDLVPPPEWGAHAFAGLSLPMLEKMLARADVGELAAGSLEDWLCDAFAVPRHAVAPITLQADGIAPENYFWLRADPVHLQLRINEVVLQSGLGLSGEESQALVDTLNQHFAEDGLTFFAPHPGRWYLRLDEPTELGNAPLAQVHGENVREQHMQGRDALRWNRMLAELQMLLYHHPVNEVREARREPAVSSLWLWGEGYAPALHAPGERLHSDNALAQAFGVVAGMTVGPLDANEGGLVVWDGMRRAVQGGMPAAWRDALSGLERDCLLPAWQALRQGKLDCIVIDVLREKGARRYTLGRRARWRFWRAVRPLVDYSGG